MSSCVAADRDLGGQFFSAPFAFLDFSVTSETATVENPVEMSAIDIMEASTNADENDDVVEFDCCSYKTSDNSSVCNSCSHDAAFAPICPVYYIPVVFVPCWYSSVMLTS